MEWDVLLHPDFETWLLEQERGVRITIAAHAALLKQCGPSLGRPQVDTLKGSKLANLKELDLSTVSCCINMNEYFLIGISPIA